MVTEGDRKTRDSNLVLFSFKVLALGTIPHCFLHNLTNWALCSGSIVMSEV